MSLESLRLQQKTERRTYPAIREMFRLSDDISLETLRDILLPMPQQVPVAEIARTQQEQAEPLTQEEVVEAITLSYRCAEQYWKSVFLSDGRGYAPTRLVTFSGAINTGCGTRDAKGGPFFCPTDNAVYFPPSFYDVLRDRLFAISDELSIMYVTFHEMSHSAQSQLGILEKVFVAQQAQDRNGRAYLSKALEMHADYLAGCALRTMHEQNDILREGDAKKLYWSLVATGDDMLRVKNRVPINIAHFTHGSARERAEAFWSGLMSGNWKTAEQFINARFNVATK